MVILGHKLALQKNSKYLKNKEESKSVQFSLSEHNKTNTTFFEQYWFY